MGRVHGDKNQTLRTSIHSTKKDYQLLIFSKSKNKPNNLSFQNFLNRLKKTFHLKKKTAKKKKNTFFSSTVLSSSKKRLSLFFMNCSILHETLDRSASLWSTIYN